MYGLAIVMAGLIYLPLRAQLKSDTHRASFSGEWRAKEPISMGGNIVCCYNSGDRMLAKTMKITEGANLLTVDFASSFPGEAVVPGQEKLAFDGKVSEINQGHGKGKKFTVKLSADGQTMTVNSVVHFTAAVPYHVNIQRQEFVNVTEVWKLSADGKSIAVEAKAKSNSFGSKERLWKTVFNKVS